MPLLVISGSVKKRSAIGLLYGEAMIAKSSLLFLIVQNCGGFTENPIPKSSNAVKR